MIRKEISHSQQEAQKFHRIGRWMGLFRIVLGLLFLGVFLVSSFSIVLADWIRSIVVNPWGVLAIYLFVLQLGSEMLNFPMDFLSGYRLAHRFGVSHQPFSAWLGDQLKASTIQFALVLAGFEILYWLMRESSQILFPWWAGLGFLLFLLVSCWLTPIVLLPVFFKVQPVHDGRLKKKLTELACQSETRIQGIFQYDLSRKSRTANAALIGLGKTRRILLSDTLLREFTHGEISVVLAHELAHHKKRHILKLIVTQTLLGVGTCYLVYFLLGVLGSFLGISHPSDPSGLPLFLMVLVAGGFFISPLGHWISRRMERGCDSYALELTQDPASFSSAMRKLSRLNLAEESPSRWVELLFYSHPPISCRLEQGERFRREQLGLSVKTSMRGDDSR